MFFERAFEIGDRDFPEVEYRGGEPRVDLGQGFEQVDEIADPAGAAGCDFGTNARHKKDVVWGGLVGVFGAITLTAGIAVLIVAGFYGTEAGKAMIASGTFL